MKWLTMLLLACTGAVAHAGLASLFSGNYNAYNNILNDTLEVKYYQSGKIESVALSEFKSEKNVSLHFSEDGRILAKTVNYKDYPRVITEYDEHGKRMHQTTQGDVGGCIGPIGKEYFWTASGRMSKEITHSSTGGPCSEKILIREEREFYPNSTAVRSIRKYNNSYEGSGDRPCGRWKTFDKNGRVTSTRNFISCDKVSSSE